MKALEKHASEKWSNERNRRRRKISEALGLVKRKMRKNLKKKEKKKGPNTRAKKEMKMIYPRKIRKMGKIPKKLMSTTSILKMKWEKAKTLMTKRQTKKSVK